MPLAVGSNTINVVVTSQDDTTAKTYFISVNRENQSSRGQSIP